MTAALTVRLPWFNASMYPGGILDGGANLKVATVNACISGFICYVFVLFTLDSALAPTCSGLDGGLVRCSRFSLLLRCSH